MADHHLKVLRMDSLAAVLAEKLAVEQTAQVAQAEQGLLKQEQSVLLAVELPAAGLEKCSVPAVKPAVKLAAVSQM